MTAVQPDAPAATPAATEPAATPAWRAWVPGALLLAGAWAAVASVPHYDLRIVGTYVVLWVVLAAAVVRGWRVGVTGRLWNGLVLAAAGAIVWLVPTFTYVPADQARTLRALLAVGTAAVGVVFALAPRWHRAAALTLAALVFAAGSIAVIKLDPLPKIDTWYTVQQAANATFHGRTMYGRVYEGPPNHFMPYTYLPWTAVLLLPFKVLVHDVRWGLAVAQLIGAGLVVAVARTRSAVAGRPALTPARADTAAAAGALLLLLPGWSTSVEQSWTEPLIFSLVALCLFGVARRVPWLAVAALALALASKQHVALLLPLFAAWRAFGVRRTVTAAVAAGVLVAPWALTNPAGMFHDAVSLLATFHPIQFSDTLYLAAMHELDWTPPFWLTGLVVVALVVGTTWAVRRFDPSPARFAAIAALALFGANLINKQAFYNQFWLVAALVLMGWAAGGRERLEPAQERPAEGRATGAQPAVAAASERT